MRTPVTEGAGKCLVFGSCFSQLLARLLMAWHTERSRGSFRIRYLERMMHGVADETIVHGLSLGMRLMAFGAVGYEAVHIMTESTRLLGMFTGIIFKFLALLFMTGKAGSYKIVGQGEVKRLVGVRMTAQAILQLKMGPSFMAF